MFEKLTALALMALTTALVYQVCLIVAGLPPLASLVLK